MRAYPAIHATKPHGRGAPRGAWRGVSRALFLFRRFLPSRRGFRAIQRGLRRSRPSLSRDKDDQVNAASRAAPRTSSSGVISRPVIAVNMAATPSSSGP